MLVPALVAVQACSEASAPTGAPGGTAPSRAAEPAGEQWPAPARYAKGAVTVEQVTVRIRATALEYSQNGIAATRAGFYDIAFPKDVTEFEQMAGHGLLLLSVVVRDSTEIPPQRAYVRSFSGDTVLQPLFGVSSQIDPADAAVLTTLGGYRNDTMYLFPVDLKFSEGVLLIDFASNRQEFFLERFPGVIPASLAVLPRDRPGGSPSYEYTGTMIEREYPGLLGWFLTLCSPSGASSDRLPGLTTSLSADR